MKTLRILALLFAVWLLLAAVAPGAYASAFDKKTYVTFRESVALPGGLVLKPGEYTMKVPFSFSPNMVEVMNRDETKVYATVFAIPTERMEPSAKPVFRMGEAPVGNPVPLEVWFYPGTLTGWEFPKAK